MSKRNYRTKVVATGTVIPMNWEKQAADYRELLEVCKSTMEISIKDFEENINPYLEAIDLHPITQTPQAMKNLVRKIEKELKT